MNKSIEHQRHREYEQEQRRIFWRKLTVRCIVADVKHKKPVDADLAEWAKAQVLGTTTKW